MEEYMKKLDLLAYLFYLFLGISFYTIILLVLVFTGFLDFDRTSEIVGQLIGLGLFCFVGFFIVIYEIKKKKQNDIFVYKLYDAYDKKRKSNMRYDEILKAIKEICEIEKIKETEVLQCLEAELKAELSRIKLFSWIPIIITFFLNIFGSSNQSFYLVSFMIFVGLLYYYFAATILVPRAEYILNVIKNFKSNKISYNKMYEL
jgi:hypothetical protein